MNVPGTILVTGVSGQVGGAVSRLLARTSSGTTIAAPTRAEMDLADPDSIRNYVRQARPRWIVSCGAYTAVDAAETDRDAAFAINASAPGVLAEEAAAAGAALIHLSTDYVFDGSGERPWVETDATGPVNIYGASKLAGEQAIAAADTPHLILRTSWVYSGGGKNFVRTMLRLLSTRTEPLRIVGDQHGSPTSAEDLATAMLSIMQLVEQEAGGGPPAAALKNLSGVYHCAGFGETTWAGLAEAVRQYLIAEHRRTPPEIVPIATSEYPTPATRPLNSRLNCGKLATAFGIRLPLWSTSAVAALRQLAETDLPRETAPA